MTIDKAITVLERERAEWQPDVDDKVDTAHQLGIEALKQLEVLRLKPYLDPRDRLPGETEE